MPIKTYISNGYVVGYSPEFGVTARTSLSKTATRLARQGTLGADRLRPYHFEALEGVSGQEIEVGAFGDRLKKAGNAIKKAAKPVMKAAKKVVKVAHDVTQSKVVTGIQGQLQKMVPPPYNSLVPIAQQVNKQAAKLVGKAVADPKGKAAKVANTAKRVAAGTVSLAALEKEAKALGVPVDEAKALATAGRLEILSRTDPRAAAAKQVLKMAAAAQEGEPAGAQALVTEHALRQQYPGARAFVIKGRNGKVYNTIVVPQ